MVNLWCRIRSFMNDTVKRFCPLLRFVPSFGFRADGAMQGVLPPVLYQDVTITVGFPE